jgi:hypothetical protein
MKSWLPAAALGLLVFIIAGCDETERRVECRWKTGPLVIDGLDSDWTGRLVPLDKPNISVGFCNDDTSLFLFLATTDKRLVRQIVRLGLTLWFDPDPAPPKPKKVLGIHYPMGMALNRPPASRLPPPDGRPGGHGQTEMFQELLKNMEILGPAPGQIFRTVPEGSHGLGLKLVLTPDQLSYELRIPLKKGPEVPYALAADTGKFFRLNLEIPSGETVRREKKGEDQPEGMDVGMNGLGGMGGGRGGMGRQGGGPDEGRGGGRHGSGAVKSGPYANPEPSAPLSLWLKIQLAAKP